MADLLNEWQGDVFRVVIKSGKYLAEAYTTLVMIENWLDKLRANEFNTRTEWGNFTDGLSNCEVQGWEWGTGICGDAGEDLEVVVEGFGAEGYCGEGEGCC